MRLSMPFPRLAPVILVAALGAAFLALAVGKLGGGSGNGGTDVNKVLETAFSGDSFKSGRFDARLSASLQGAGAGQGNVELQMNGAFQAQAKDTAPQLDVDMTIDGAGSPLQFGVVSTGDQAFIEAQGAAYRVPADQFQSTFAAQGSDRQSAAPLAALGVDPKRWLVNASDEGSAKVGGVDTDHVSAGVDTQKLIDDVLALGAKTGNSQLSGLSAADKAQVRKSVQSAKVDVYAARSDGTLRKLAAQVSLNTPQGSGNVSFEMQFSDVNKPQKITAPDNALPLSALDGDLGARLLAGIQGGTTRGGSSGGTPKKDSSGSSRRSSSKPDAGGAGSAAGGTQPGVMALPQSAQAYLKCVEKSKVSADLQKCAPLLD
jgi:hypothetical protein